MRLLLLAVLLAAVVPSTALASPVATDDGAYAAFGRVFPDPLGGCRQTGVQPCSPNAQGNVPATQFIGIDEFVRGMEYLNSKPEWARYLEVWPLDGRTGANADGTPPGTGERASFPGNDLGRFEFTPRESYRSAGLPTSGTGRQKSDLYVLRVTDERAPDKGKKRYAISLSIHGIERAGVEGGTRMVEDLVTAATNKTLGRRIVPDGTIAGAPTFQDVLRKAIIYVAYPNPDGWRRGSVSSGGFAFQRYNGNGVDVNRDWPDVGFAFRPYSPLSEPESKALAGFFGEVKGAADFDGGVDLHGQLTADALSFTLLGHGRHDFAKDTRIREVAKAIHRVSEKALAWSPMIVPNDTPKSQNGCTPSVDGTEACARIYGQTWGTVYDTINYTTTGALGDWFDSPVGLDADGVDNEMSFSHLDRNIVFDPHGEQLHVDGNKALIYAQLSEIINPPTAAFGAPGRKGYIANTRVRRAEQDNQSPIPPGTVAQAKISGASGTPGSGQVVFDFPVKRGPQGADGSPDAGKNVFNGGLRVDITKLNVGGVSDGNAVTTLKVQCKGCDDHPGIDPDADGFITVAEDYNQSPVYAQAGLTAAVNRPATRNRKGEPIAWRAVLEGGPLDAGARMDVEFFQGPATASGDTSGGAGPRERAYDVANTDFLGELNHYVPGSRDDFTALDPVKIASGSQKLDGYSTLVLADDPLPGAGDAEAYYGAVRAWVERGGNLVLTDGALRALPRVTGVPAGAIASRKLYVGQIAFGRSDSESTLKEPLVASPNDVSQDGARFNSGNRRQTYEPTPLGFAIQDADGSDFAASPAWDVDAAAVTKAGGKVLASAVEAGASGSSPDYARAAYGEVPSGKGRVRFLGALLPQPSEAFDHDFGIEPYAVTYTGWILFCNMLGANCRAQASSAATACPSTAGFAHAEAKPKGRRVRMGFTRRLGRRVSVDVFQVSHGRRVLKERLVARFKKRRKSFTWRGKGNPTHPSDGIYFVRFRTRYGKLVDTRRTVLRRRNGRFHKRPSFHRRSSCGTLESYKLERAVFGGRRNVPLRIAYRLRRKAKVKLQVLRGKKVVRTFKARTRRGGKTFRLRYRAKGAPRRDHRVRITVTRGKRRTVATLTSRRL